MIKLDQIFFWGCFCVTMPLAFVTSIRTNYLLSPPSNEAVEVVRSFQNNPKQWQADPSRIVFYNEAEGFEVRRFAQAQSIQVLKRGKLVPTLDQALLEVPTQNQYHVNRAIDDWMER